MTKQAFSWSGFMNAWNNGNVDRILEFYADNVEVIGAQPMPLRGKEDVRKNLETLFETFSDLNGDAEVLVASGEYVSALIHITSKHTGTLKVGGKSFPPTNKVVKDTLATFLKLDANGKIEREWDVTNQLETFHQLGIAPPQPSGARVR